MRLLLDTHALLWWVADDARLSARADEVLADEAVEIHVSAASAWEIAIKARAGKLDAEPLAHGLAAEIERQGFLPLSISLDHAERAGLLPPHHRDPFDRMLIAQAQAENLHLVSNERIFERYGVVRVW
jgi:PIN domain nuclease of toxin-antitoxin system